MPVILQMITLLVKYGPVVLKVYQVVLDIIKMLKTVDKPTRAYHKRQLTLELKRGGCPEKLRAIRRAVEVSSKGRL